MRIGIIDSGIGGLTLLTELIKKYPNNEYYYCGDNNNMPYGSKDKKELEMLIKKIIEFLSIKNIDILITACGTISTFFINNKKTKYNFKIYDIITPTIKYINESNFNNVGLIATETTVRSQIFQTNISKKIFCQECSLLAWAIESNLNKKELNNLLGNYLKNLPNNIDSLILGCTHYPIIKKEIEKYFHNVKLINMSTILVNELEISNKDLQVINLYFSKIDDNLIKNIKRILKYNYKLDKFN